MSLLAAVRDLQRRRGRERRGLALAEGVRLVEEMLGAGVICKGAVAASMLDSTPRGVALRAALTARHVPIEAVSDDIMLELALTEQTQGIIAVYQPREWTLADLSPVPRQPLVILDAVQDPGNVGTIARAAHALGAAGMIALAGTADVTNPKAVRAAMGALFRLPCVLADDATVLAWLTEHRVELWAAAMDGQAAGDLRADTAVALIVGNEGAGVRPSLLAAATRRVSIPIRPDAESLNVATAAGILLYLLTR
ncbi:MAG TPA: RNA methyltransferase [Gemmatimonadales bacterium]|jgi:TrmH family RNA methyltransferase|nr:RNA methyltransferase [Gemmatimonadales bacterium]